MGIWDSWLQLSRCSCNVLQHGVTGIGSKQMLILDWDSSKQNTLTMALSTSTCRWMQHGAGMVVRKSVMAGHLAKTGKSSIWLDLLSA